MHERGTTHPAENGTTVTGLTERSAILCRTCLRPLTWETRTEPGYKPRTGFYDDATFDPNVCFKSIDYQHHPLTDREWAYYEAGQKSVTCECCRGRCACGGKRVSPSCSECGPGYRVGDDGCRHGGAQ